MAMVFIRTCRNFEWAWNCIRVPSVSGRRPRGTCSKALGPANHGCRKHSAALGRAASPVASMRRQRESALVEACRKSRQSGSPVATACAKSATESRGPKGGTPASRRKSKQPQDQMSHRGPKSWRQTSGARNSGKQHAGPDSSCITLLNPGKSKRTCRPKPSTETQGCPPCAWPPDRRMLPGRRSRCTTGPRGREWQYAIASKTCRKTPETQASLRPLDCA
mmetsp:Transcript_108474/g.329744  ORF Transcript_108474/g.329744 Transcript_108474/m.329744 type:complete len:221 (-) Transcript_108474:907-1569(-)